MRAMYIRSGNEYLYCRVIGVGKPLLLLHGNGEDYKIFEQQIIHFSKKYQVIALDTRGHGYSDHGKQLLTFQRVAEDILTVLHYFKLPKVSIMGFSDGGNIALYFCSHYPDKVAKLIVIGANYKVVGLKKESLIEVKKEYFLLAILGCFFLKAEKKKQVIDLMWHQLDLKSTDLITITAPTLVVAGENDVIEESHTRKLHELISKSKLVIVPAASHFLMVEKYEEFNRLAEEFLSGEDKFS
ncbi:alpha/beta fold hydrolase [Carnobacterium jeotgali]|uniref:alpha/beta fold hydrolase n=1 Tax=Carnobacterium jeotgali TaxID=545534 RepID=UPI003C76E018